VVQVVVLAAALVIPVVPVVKVECLMLDLAERMAVSATPPVAEVAVAV
jgi:hypothetical protein